MRILRTSGGGAISLRQQRRARVSRGRARAGVLAAAVVTLVVPTVVVADAAEPATYYFAGFLPQEYLVPAGVREVRVEAIGAPGGPGYGPYGGAGGYGARAKAELSVTPGETLSDLVGEEGGHGECVAWGGFGGGGNGNYSACSGGSGGGGGS